MGETCSKTANAAALENRRIQREIRLGILPVSRPVSPYTSPQASQTTLSARQVHGPIGQRKVSPSDNRSRALYTLPRRGFENSTSSVGRGPHNNAVRISPSLPHFASNERSPMRPGMCFPSKATHQPSGTMGENVPKRLHWLNKSGNLKSNGDAGMHRDFLKEDKKIKPVIRQALNLLCVEEIRCRTEISNEATTQLKKLEDKLTSIADLESIRASVLEIIKLQTKSREAVIEQELTERKLLFVWMNQTVEEDRLKALIDATKERHQNSVFVCPTSSRSGSRFFASYERPHSQAVEIREKSPLESIAYHDPCNKEATKEKDFFKNKISYSKPVCCRNAFIEEDVQSDDLNRKIGRQTYLMHQTIPSYSYKNMDIVPDVYSSNFRLGRERDASEFLPSDQISPRFLPNFSEEGRSFSSYRSTVLDPFKTPRRTPVELKNDSDLAMRRRLAALLLV
ncbi:hypothetical protein C3747_9g353 [Trypanosoma cruzi]|uniref:Uncharacterized protein n=2 Tax=Trypanosoma cruzi TaxID=5693 RepID=Q4E392_TRYCC|nr:hypothetical protein, conserved [Trypanosoma cruzi]EAN99278.1 hypothetical protein, conserved [Trypanosoma cruzi]PWV19599.1 hypothetical protein C3747_9g353 [Trypanosoma cruzi]|eukprot:XP_821129.1 hypothetical protein [Trypanosoma cruzi strain CL Brener]